MRIPYQFRDVVLAALLLSSSPKAATRQQSPSAARRSHTFSCRPLGPLSGSDVRSLHRSPMGPRLYSSSRD